jgi:hypothetical protein
MMCGLAGQLSIHQHGLPPQRLRRLLAVATPVLDGKPAEMRESAAQRDIQYARLRRSAEELAARTLEADVAQCGLGRLAETGDELALQCARGCAGDGGELAGGEFARSRRAHRLEHATHAARQHGHLARLMKALSQDCDDPQMTFTTIAHHRRGFRRKYFVPRIAMAQNG